MHPAWRPRVDEAARQAFQKALELAPERQEFRLGFGHYLRRVSTRSMQSGQDPGPSIQRGLELAQELLAVRPEWPDARLLRGSLLALQAALPSATSGQKQEWRGQAREDLSRALSTNPGFQREWGSALQRLQSSGP